MAAIGRNDPCPCGSGKKHKLCCQKKGGSAPASKASKMTMYILGAVLLGGLALVVISLVTGEGGACPPGQAFDAAHGHCH